MEGGFKKDSQGEPQSPRFDPVTGAPLVGAVGDASDARPVSHSIDNGNRVVEEIPPKMSMGSKILNIFIEPSSVFKNVYYYNDWLTPLIITSVGAMAGALLAMQYNGDARSQFNELMKVPGGVATETVGTITSYVTVLLIPAGLMLGWLISAGVLFVLGSFMLENVDFKKLYSLAAFSSMPVVFTQIINGISKLGQTAVVSSYDDFIDTQMPWTISLARIIPADGLLGKVLTVYDVFGVWAYWLLFLALSYGLRNKKSQSGFVTFVYILLGAGFTVGMLALQGLFRPPGM